ncbi:AbrB/MazE/SpoVT family DNA-binding domain-containing protein [Candidatus Woesearchaeota archaeon]|nr:AbrB/MazE/SpoVT family DNA-binding domain-containing protein [Candidatus Woesearchaeota archaeon]
MVEIQTKAKKWGSSIGVILPKSLVEDIGIKPNETITIEVKKSHKAKEFFGLLKGWKRSTQKIKDEVRKGW